MHTLVIFALLAGSTSAASAAPLVGALVAAVLPAGAAAILTPVITVAPVLGCALIVRLCRRGTPS